MRLLKITTFFTFLILSVFESKAQRFETTNSYNIHRQIKQLNNLTHILYLAAHPDDENTGLLSYFVHEKNYRTSYLSLTRGEGGQNLIGNELGTGLGLIRNYELLAARNLDGASQLFSSTIDFGFSKNPEETLEIWDKDKIVKEVQDIIQTLRPDVIICRFPTTGEGGHGHHTASALIAIEAYNNTLKDPAAFHPQRVLFNSFRFGDRNTIKDHHYQIVTQQYNPGLGLSYGQLAGISRSIHRSQGVGTPQRIGLVNEYFELLAGSAPQHHDLVNLDVSWNRIKHPEVTAMINSILKNFDFNQPAHSIPELISLRKYIKTKVKDTYWKNEKLKELDEIILQCSGLMIELLSEVPESPAGAEIKLKTSIVARGNSLKIKNIIFNNESLANNIQLGEDTIFTQSNNISIDKNTEITQPFWLKEQSHNSHYSYDNTHLLENKVTNAPSVKIILDIHNEDFELNLPICYKYLHPLRGDVIELFRVTPDVVINPLQEILFVKNDNKNIIELKVKSYISTPEILIELFNDNNELIHSAKLNNLTPLKDSVITLDLNPNANYGESIHVIASIGGQKYSLSKHDIKYDHLPELVYYTPAKIKSIKPRWKVPQQKIAYIHGAGDNIPNTLKNIGLNVDVLPTTALTQSNLLNNYSTIILGIRAYNTIEGMNTYMDFLLKYVQEGGRLIVQYNTSNNLLTNNLGPYPFKISRDRVTEENSKVTILNPSDPILNHPYKISDEDFNGWIQERGLYFPTDIDSRYNVVFKMNDKGEKPSETSLMYTKYGKGIFIYTGISFFRQIPAGHSGAIKLFFNCLELK